MSADRQQLIERLRKLQHKCEQAMEEQPNGDVLATAKTAREAADRIEVLERDAAVLGALKNREALGRFYEAINARGWQPPDDELSEGSREEWWDALVQDLAYGMQAALQHASEQSSENVSSQEQTGGKDG